MRHKTEFSDYAEYHIGVPVKHEDGSYGHVVGFDTIGKNDVLRIKILWSDGQTTAEFPETLTLLHKKL